MAVEKVIKDVIYEGEWIWRTSGYGLREASSSSSSSSGGGRADVEAIY